MRTVLALTMGLGLAAGASAEDAVTPINKRGADEKKYVADTTVAFLKAIRTSPHNPTFVEYESSKPADGRLEWKIKAAYSGSITGKKFASDITIKIDTAVKDKWEVLSIHYSDDNKVTGGRSSRTSTPSRTS